MDRLQAPFPQLSKAADDLPPLTEKRQWHVAISLTSRVIEAACGRECSWSVLKLGVEYNRQGRGVGGLRELAGNIERGK
jgi:hypothetical protein